VGIFSFVVHYSFLVLYVSCSSNLRWVFRIRAWNVRFCMSKFLGGRGRGLSRVYGLVCVLLLMCSGLRCPVSSLARIYYLLCYCIRFLLIVFGLGLLFCGVAPGSGVSCVLLVCDLRLDSYWNRWFFGGSIFVRLRFLSCFDGPLMKDFVNVSLCVFLLCFWFGFCSYFVFSCSLVSLFRFPQFCFIRCRAWDINVRSLISFCGLNRADARLAVSIGP